MTSLGIAASDYRGLFEAAHVGEEEIFEAASSGASENVMDDAIADEDSPYSSTKVARDLSPEAGTRASVHAANIMQRGRMSSEDEVRHFNQQQAARRYERAIKVYHKSLLKGMASERKGSQDGTIKNGAVTDL